MIKQKENTNEKHIFGNFEMTIFWKYTNKKKRKKNEIKANILIGTLFYT